MNRRVHRNSEMPFIIAERDLTEGKPGCNKKRGGGAKEEGDKGHFKSSRIKQILYHLDWFDSFHI